MMWLILAALVIAIAAVVGLWLRCRALAVSLHEAHEMQTDQTQRLGELEHLATRNEAILQNAMDGFFVLGEDYQFLEVNDAFCEMTGYAREELTQLTMSDLEVSSPVQDDGSVAYWRTGLHHFSTAHRHKAGHVVQLESCVVVLYDRGRKILVGFARDVTERNRAETALRKSESQYRNLVETSRDLIWTIDLEGRWTFVNNAAREIYDYEPEEMIGRLVSGFTRPEYRQRFEQILAEVRSGRSRLRFETEHLRRDGTPVYLSINAIPVRDDYGNIVGCTGTATDVTDRKQAEGRLREANARFESLVAGMPLGYIVWSTDYRVLEWNPAASSVFGYTADEALGKRATDLIVPQEGLREFKEMCDRLLAGEACGGSVLVNQRHDGEKIRCEWYNTVLPDMAGGVHGVATLVRDVSERERLESQLRQSQKLESLGVLAGGVAHDFNNLLVGIMGNASLAMESVPANSRVNTLLERVVSAGRRATELTQRMLAYAGRAACDVQIMDMNALVSEMADFATAAIPKSVKLNIKTAENLPLIKADSGQVQQVIMNLLINAAEAIGERGGTATVSTWTEELTDERIRDEFPDRNLKPGRYAVLQVADTGCGMPPEVVSRIFDPFYTTKFAGRGLGLSAILGIVRTHGGAVSVESTVGEGTTFRVLFPAATAKAATSQQPAGGNHLPRGSTVLVIDDEEDIRDVVEAVLGSRGINVLAADDGESGIAMFREHQDSIDAVLLDMNMPGMNGEAVFAALREISPDVKVILSTGYSEQETATHFADAPLAGFVHKPYTASALVDKIGAAITG